MSIATPPSYFPEMSITLSLSDLLKRVDGEETPVLTDSGAVVTFEVTDLAGTVQGLPGTGEATDDDWYLTVNTPATPGPYKIKVTVTLDTIIGKFVDRFDVVPF